MSAPFDNGQELKSRGIRITENYTRYYGLSLLRHYYGHQIVVPMVSATRRVDRNRFNLDLDVERNFALADNPLVVLLRHKCRLFFHS